MSDNHYKWSWAPVSERTSIQPSGRTLRLWIFKLLVLDPPLPESRRRLHLARPESRTILQQECGPSLSALSNPWTPPPREPLQKISPSAISLGLSSSSSSVQDNTASAVPTPPSTPSGSKMSNYPLGSSPTTPQRRPTPCSIRPTSSAYYSQPRRTASIGESIGHGFTGHPQGCPVATMRLHVAYL